LLAARDVPNLEGVVLATGGQGLSIRRECDALDSSLVPLEGAAKFALWHVPQADVDVIVAGSGQGLAVGRKRQREDFAVVVSEGSQLPAGGKLPEPNRGVVAAAGDDLAVGADRDGLDRTPVPPRVLAQHGDQFLWLPIVALLARNL